MENTPKYIYLNLGTNLELNGVDFNELEDITWSRERIHDADIKYQLKDK